MKKILIFVLLIIITVPAFYSLLNSSYFTMHDNQHIVRLYLLDQGIRQGVFYPRWVDGLGFGYGYPLFNFYPPLVYYVAEAFHLVGLSLIWSIKLTFITGFILASFGSYLLASKLINKLSALLCAVFYTYFLYHGINIYVRGALAEFFSMGFLPFVLFYLLQIADSKNKKPHISQCGFLLRFEKLISCNKRSIIYFSLAFGLLILAHPLIAFPSLLYIAIFFLFSLFFITKDKTKYILNSFFGFIGGLALSAFFWLPSLIEKKYTMVDAILTKELANYKLHYVYLSQLFQSNWGYGGSVPGINDGMSFQIGKIYLGLIILSIIFSSLYLIIHKKFDKEFKYYLLFLALAFFSLFMTTQYSSVIWDNIHFFWYLQFPWRFLTFAGIFISLITAFFVYFLIKILPKNNYGKIISLFFSFLIGLSVLVINVKYFKPQKLISATDRDLTSNYEIQWNISRSSYEFIPKSVKTKISDMKTTIPDIDPTSLPEKIYAIEKESGKIKIEKNNFGEKNLLVNSKESFNLRLNTFYFPGWHTYLDNHEISINHNNPYQLMNVDVPNGNHKLSFRFEDTPVRIIANYLSILTVISFVIVLVRSRNIKSLKDI